MIDFDWKDLAKMLGLSLLCIVASMSIYSLVA